MFCGILVGKRCFKDLLHALDILTAHGIHSVSTEIKRIIKPQLSCLFYAAVLFNFLKLPTSFRFLLHFPTLASVLKRSFNPVLSVLHRPVWIAHISKHPSTSQPYNQSHLRCSLTILFEARGRVISTAAFCSGVPGFKSRLGDRLSWLSFCVVTFSPARQIPGYRLKLFHSLYFITYLLTVHHLSYEKCHVVT
jgi:hypothetical protein